MKILNEIVDKFKDATANDLSNLSHKEDAWIKYNGKNEFIDYTEAFSLKAL